MAIVALSTKLDAKKPHGHPSSLEQAKPRSHAGCLTECDVRVWKVGALSGHNFECLQDSRGLSRQTDGRVARSGVRHEIDVWRHEHIRLAKYVLRCGAPIHELAGSRQQPLSTACTVRRHGVPGHPPWSHHVSVKPPVYE